MKVIFLEISDSVKKIIKIGHFVYCMIVLPIKYRNSRICP